MKNQKGFTLIEIMVAFGLASILGYVIMTLMKQQADGQKQARRDMEVNEVFANMTKLTSNINFCNYNLLGMSRGSNIARVDMSHDINATPVYQTGVEIPGTGITIKQIAIAKADNTVEPIGGGAPITIKDCAPPTLTAYNTHVCLYVLVEKKNANGTSSKTVSNTFLIPVYVADAEFIGGKYVEMKALCDATGPGAVLVDVNTQQPTNPPEDAIICSENGPGNPDYHNCYGMCYKAPATVNSNNAIITGCM